MQEPPIAAQMFGAVIAALVGLWVSNDAQQHGRPRTECWLWGMGVFMIMILVLPVYLYLRYTQWNKIAVTPAASQTGTCRYCGILTENDPIYCPGCSMQLKGAESVHGKK